MMDLRDPIGLFRRQTSAFRGTFSGPQADLVLSFLSRFCCAYTTTHRGGRDETLINEGRRQVWLEITKRLGWGEEVLERMIQQGAEKEREYA